MVSALATAVAMLICIMLRQLALGVHARRRRIAWALLLTPLLTPTLLCAYYYRGWSLQWSHQPIYNELMYLAVLTVRLAPAAGLILYLAPPPTLSAQAVHAAKLAGRRIARIGLFFRRRASVLIAAAAVFVLAFGDYEIAVLLDCKAWTINLFDAAKFRMPLNAMLTRHWPAMATQFLVLGAAIWLWRRAKRHAAPTDDPARQLHPLVYLITWLYLGVAAIMLAAAPLSRVIGQAVEGASSLFKQPSFAKDLLIGAGFAVGSALLSYVFARVILRRLPGLLAILICLPGMLGSLMLSLLVLRLLQWPRFNWFYLNDRPEPLLIALTWLLIPIALLLSVLGDSATSPQSLHAMRLLAASKDGATRAWVKRLRQHLVGRTHAWSIVLLFIFAFFEITATHLLHPSDMTPSSTAAYNNMHYGQNAVLSARLSANLASVVGVCAAVLALGWLINLFWPMRSIKLSRGGVG